MVDTPHQRKEVGHAALARGGRAIDEGHQCCAIVAVVVPHTAVDGDRTHEGEQGDELLRAQGTLGVVGEHIAEQRGQRIEECFLEGLGQAVPGIVGVGVLLFEQLGGLGGFAEVGENVVVHVVWCGKAAKVQNSIKSAKWHFDTWQGCKSRPWQSAIRF